MQSLKLTELLYPDFLTANTCFLPEPVCYSSVDLQLLKPEVASSQHAYEQKKESDTAFVKNGKQL